MTRTVAVPPERLVRWCDNFITRHGPTIFDVVDGRLSLTADDGESASAVLPFGRSYSGPPDPASVASAAASPLTWGVLLVRKGGFAVALLDGSDHVVASKVGQRHVQGRTKAGGQSQQRFARRRDNQARQAYEAAADHAARILCGDAGVAGPITPRTDPRGAVWLGPGVDSASADSARAGSGEGSVVSRHAADEAELLTPRRPGLEARPAREGRPGVQGRPGLGARPGLEALVVGGDRQAVDIVLEDRRLAPLRDLVVDPWLPVPDPRRAVLDDAIATARSLQITLTSAQ